MTEIKLKATKTPDGRLIISDDELDRFTNHLRKDFDDLFNLLKSAAELQKKIDKKVMSPEDFARHYPEPTDEKPVGILPTRREKKR